jgi:hypothetical protein
MLRPQDVVVLCWVLVRQGQPWRYSDLAAALSISASEAHKSVQRLLAANLIKPLEWSAGSRRGTDYVIWKPGAEEFLIHGVKYAFYAERGPIVRGVPTGVAAPALRERFVSGGEIPVWPDPNGDARGYGLKPLYPTVPIAVQGDPLLYAALALVDAIRDGRARERALGEAELKRYLAEY